MKRISAIALVIILGLTLTSVFVGCDTAEDSFTLNVLSDVMTVEGKRTERNVYKIGETMSLFCVLTPDGRNERSLTHTGETPIYVRYTLNGKDAYTDAEASESKTVLPRMKNGQKSREVVTRVFNCTFSEVGSYVFYVTSSFEYNGERYEYTAALITAVVSDVFSDYEFSTPDLAQYRDDDVRATVISTNEELEAVYAAEKKWAKEHRLSSLKSYIEKGLTRADYEEDLASVMKEWVLFPYRKGEAKEVDFEKSRIVLVDFMAGNTATAYKLGDISVSDGDLSVDICRLPDEDDGGAVMDPRQLVIVAEKSVFSGTVSDVRIDGDDTNAAVTHMSKQRGSLYWLGTAYENGYLTAEDIKNIAYLHCGDESTDYTPKPLVPNELTPVQEAVIARAYIDMLNIVLSPSDAEGICIEKYYGTYNGSIAVMMGGMLHLEVVGNETIAGTEITYGNSNRIIVWKE